MICFPWIRRADIEEADIESEEAGQEESADAGETSDDTADMDDQAIEEAVDETSEDAAYSTTARASEGSILLSLPTQHPRRFLPLEVPAVLASHSEVWY